MSGPNDNTRFNPLLRGTRTADNLIGDAAELRKLAQVQAIRDAEWERVALRNDYAQARDANVTAAIDLPGNLQDRVRAFVDRFRFLATFNRAVRIVLPYPISIDELTSDPHRKQRGYSEAAVTGGLQAQEQIAAQALDGADTEAASIVDAAWTAAAPSAPDRAMGDSIDDACAGLRAALTPLAGTPPAANAAAQRILRQAMADGDTTLIYALLGSQDARRILTIAGVNRMTLGRIWAESKLAAVQPDANGVHPLGAGFPGAAFLQLQSTDQALAKLPTLAKAYFDAEMTAAKQLMQTDIVKAAMRP